MLNILINAYAVSPNWGSEQGMGWNWVINIARSCNVHVITEGEWRAEIEEAVANLPQKDNLHFYYNPVSEKIRNMCWNQGDWRFYWYYRKWQKKTLKIAKEIIAHNKIDVIHQLNMIGFREPGYLWKIKDIPFVWGPIGGMGSATLSGNYLDNLVLSDKLKFNLKKIISKTQLKYFPRVRVAAKRGIVIAATKEGKETLEKIYHKEVPFINETGCYVNSGNTNDGERNSSKLKILWVGRAIPTKRLDIALQVISKLNDKNVELTICGNGTDAVKYKSLAKSLNIDSKLNWFGKIDNTQIKELMKSSDLFLFTSVMDATSTVVLEAIEANLPILSFDTCGFGPIVKSFAGVTVTLSTPCQSICDFANIIDNFIANPSKLDDLRKSIQDNKFKLSWDYKMSQLLPLYASSLNSKNN